MAGPPWVEVGVTSTLDISPRKIQQCIAMPKCVKVQHDLQTVEIMFHLVGSRHGLFLVEEGGV